MVVVRREWMWAFLRLLCACSVLAVYASCCTNGGFVASVRQYRAGSRTAEVNTSWGKIEMGLFSGGPVKNLVLNDLKQIFLGRSVHSNFSPL